MQEKFIIIAGTEKSGTTSLFQYLADSQLLTISKTKETNYFSSPSPWNLESYQSHFHEHKTKELAYMEASPIYLGDSESTANAINSTLDNYHLVFCLRDPVERLTSNFLFLKSRQIIPDSISFDDYVTSCFEFQKGNTSLSSIPTVALHALNAGKYSYHLSNFEKICRSERISVYTFEQLLLTPQRVVESILASCSIESEFYRDYKFHTYNQTFKYRNALLQKMALFINHTFESVWRKQPSLKLWLLSIYKRFNATAKEQLEISSLTLERLNTYYREDIQLLIKHRFISEEIGNKWLRKNS